MFLWNQHLRTLCSWHPRLFKVFVLTSFCLSLFVHSAETTKAATTCIALVNNASWHVAAAWSCGVVPTMAAGDIAEIPANITIVINQNDVVNTGTIRVMGELQISNPQGDLQNNSSLTIETNGLLDNYGRQVNNGTGSTMQNNGTILNRSNSYFVNGGNLHNAGTFDNEVNAELVNSGSLISNHGAIYNDGSLTNSNAGVIQNHATGSIQNTGSATLENWSGSQIQNLGSMLNHGESLIDNDGSIFNQGTLNNGVGARIENGPGSLIETYGLLKNYNYGVILNEGHLLQRDYGELRNEGQGSRIRNKGTITVRGSADTINSAGALLVNTHQAQIIIEASGPTLRNEVNAELRNLGSITNSYNLFNQGSMFNCSGGSITNTYKFINDNHLYNYGVINGPVLGNPATSPLSKAC